METKGQLNTMSDEDLVRRIVKNNDTLLFEVLYDRFSLAIYNKCLGFATDEDEAKDLTQDVFLKLFVKLASYKGKSKFSTWLYAFTYNHCANFVNRNIEKKIMRKTVEVEIAEDPVGIEEDTSAFDDMKVEMLKEALGKISPDEKMILLMRYQDQIPIKEIEELLGIGESAVKMRIKRAKDKLVEAYSKGS